MAERSINEPAEVVEDHGGLLDVAMVCTPFAPAMADWRQGKRQEMGIVVVHLLYKQPTCQAIRRVRFEYTIWAAVDDAPFKSRYLQYPQPLNLARSPVLLFANESNGEQTCV